MGNSTMGKFAGSGEAGSGAITAAFAAILVRDLVSFLSGKANFDVHKLSGRPALEFHLHNLPGRPAEAEKFR